MFQSFSQEEENKGLATKYVNENNVIKTVTEEQQLSNSKY